MTQQGLRRGSDLKERIIHAIVSTRVSSKSVSSQRHLRNFLQQYFADVPVEDLQGRSEETMARIAVSHLDFAGKRRRRKALLRIFNPTEAAHGYTSAFTFIEMVNDDMPFIVDSVTAAINRQDLAVHMTVHPVIRIGRNSRGNIEAIAASAESIGSPESFVRFAVDRETDPQQLKLLELEIRKVLADVRIAVRDWKKMRSKMAETRKMLRYGPPGVDEDLRTESQALLDWLIDNHFTFLGYREYELFNKGKKVLLTPVEGSGLGLMAHGDSGGHPIELTKEMRRITKARDWLILTKANSRSTVHRNAYLDYVGVKIFDEAGKVRGERRFIGLLTSVAYSESPRNIPLLRHKVAKIIERAKVDPSGHRGKALLHIIETFPRDELFQSTVQDLARTTLGILNLQERQRVKFFLRRDSFRRFFSCLVYVPREKYTTSVRHRIETILKDAFGGTSVDSNVQLSESALARVHIIIRTPVGERPRISIADLEQEIAEVVVTWADRLREQLIQAFGHDEGQILNHKYANVFPAGYQDDVTPREACSDVKRIEDMLAAGQQRSVELYERREAVAGNMHFMVYSFDAPLALSDALPVLENMGVDVYTEHPYELTLRSGQIFWIQDFDLRPELADDIDIESVATRFEECFTAVLEHRIENDGLNRMVLVAQLSWRQTSLLRCYTKYLLQLGIPFSQIYMEDVLVQHPNFVRLMIDLFETQFDPGLSTRKRAEKLQTLSPAFRHAVNRARNVDEDRILAGFAGALGATLRSNYFQTNEDGAPKPYISIKLEPAKLRDAPRPRPRFEVFVFSPNVEGVHLRAGDIARGGLRWSDRREDYRTEVLGLMKAQIVKNTVIVPTGAKGGFFPKRLPHGDRDARLAAAIECYKTFIRGLLDITDNVVDDKVVTPPGIVCLDGDDPYLVVAADKGTATFSDIANELSASYGFWLDDAFASGGSAGYDHKKMGITARGAWEAVKRHFREQDLNTQRDPFSVAGIGDMSGDVFGNGMLLSRKIRLIAAFNHMHIFLDPDPDMVASFAERRRLFRRRGSSWEDYNDAVISKGGGVFSRQAKAIKLSAEARKLLDIEERSLQPDEVIKAILKMPVDLLWNGGIGTYVKASTESHADVGDRSNDTVRVNADELRCRVIGEGGNLGLTQRARIEYSLVGGRINTDFIDNSAGVDSSDREVNIKILLSDVAKHKGMSRKKRNELLASMTDDVAELVLRNNYLQTQAISMSEIRSVERIDEIARLIANLEKTGLLDRSLEYLPDETEIEDRRARKQGITRPELAVVLSYAKIDLYDGLISSGESLEDFLIVDPLRYFPTVLRRRYADLFPGHRLSRQILATLIANDIVNRMGPAFVKRVQTETEARVTTIARAYVVARQVCRARSLLQTIESLDNKIPARAQLAMMFEVSRTLRHVCYWLIEHFGDKLEIESTVERLKSNIISIYTRTGKIMSPAARQRHQTAAADFMAMGVSESLANRMSALLLTRAALDIADLSFIYKQDVLHTAKIYSTLNEALGVYWLHTCAEDLKVEGRWQAAARSHLRDDFYRIRRDIAEQILQQKGTKSPVTAANRWLADRSAAVDHFRNIISDMKLRNEVDFATLSVAMRELRALLDT